MTLGTKVRTLYEHSETGVIVRPRKNEGTPSAEWFIVRLDNDGARACIHQSMLALSNGVTL